MKYLVLVIYLKNPTMTQKLVSLKRYLLIMIMINILQLTKFNILAADVFNTRLAQANLITKTDFDAKVSSVNRKILQK